MDVKYEKEQVLSGIKTLLKTKTEKKKKIPASHLLRWPGARLTAVSKSGENWETGTEKTLRNLIFE